MQVDKKYLYLSN